MRCAIAALLSLCCEAIIASPLPSAIAKPTRPLAVDYEVHRLAPGDRYEITMRFEGDSSGRSTLRIPHEWASAQEAERGVEALEVLTRHARLEVGDEVVDDMRVAHVSHRPGAALVVRYRLKQIASGELDADGPTNYLPVIRPGYFAWIGWTTWVVPGDDPRTVHARVRFVGLPDDWNFASTFGLARQAVAFDGSIARFRDAIFVGGDFRLRSRPVQGGRLVVAVRGEWPFRDSELADRIATIVDGEREFWNDDRQHDFLVTMMPVTARPGRRSFNGTGLGQSFATFLTPVRSLDQLDGLFAHEYFHTWNAIGIGEFVQPEALGYWFTEGFTDYYAVLLRLRWHMLTLEQYAAVYDDVMRSLASLRENTLPNAAIGARFFGEPRTIGKLPYWRGMLLAARWDAQIRKASNGRWSLDDAMRDLLHEHLRGIERLDAVRIARVMRARGVIDPEQDIERHVDQGERLALDSDTLTSCIAIDTINEPIIDAGFDPINRQRVSVHAGLTARERSLCLDELHANDR